MKFLGTRRVSNREVFGVKAETLEEAKKLVYNDDGVDVVDQFSSIIEIEEISEVEEIRGRAS